MEYKFNKETRYVTRGINANIPLEIQVLVWNSIDELVKSNIETDYLQVFKCKLDDAGILIITHTQEQPEFKIIINIKKKEEYLSLDGVTIFVIDDITHSTALLSNEY